MQVRSDEDKSSVQQRSGKIKQKFKNYMGLIADKPKLGFGIQMMGTQQAGVK